MTDNFIKPSWPFVTVDREPGGGREWIHPEPPRYYLHCYPEDPRLGDDAGKWVVIDRLSDFAVGLAYRRKADCIKAFLRQQGQCVD